MTSSVHFKFKSQKEPSRVSFDGTGISVFELKREIININRLGDGSDFDLAIYNEDTNEEYNDDTTIIPRSTSVVARRLPAYRPGKGTAARYISGKMPATARSGPRVDAHITSRTENTATPSNPDLNSVQSEEDKIKAVFNLQETQWREQQEDMAIATPVAFGRGRGAPASVPDQPPPPGYLCYRCREKGHWIQACPTNNDPRFDGRYRVKRSTGIPRSFQKQVEKPESRASDGLTEDPKLSGVMVNADGDFVIAEPDKASWELYQEKAKAAAAAAAELAAIENSKELRARNILCPLDKRMFLSPTRTPCCNSTYCNDCITNALIESDFVCPACNTEGVLLDNLSVDNEAISRIKDYEKKSASATEGDTNQTPISPESGAQTIPDSVKGSVNRSPSHQPRKRPATDREKSDDVDPGASTSPAIKRQRHENRSENIGNGRTPPLGSPKVRSTSSLPLNQTYGSFEYPGTVDQMSTGAVGGQSFPPFPAYPNMGNTWGQSTALHYGPTAQLNFYSNMSNGVIPMGGHNQIDLFTGQASAVNFVPMPMPMPMPMLMPTHTPNQGFQPSLNQPQGMATFSNQQRTAFSEPFANEEDNAYFRQPVNPHRHQAKQKRLRPSDYREL